jgi:hypothetical protein
LNSFESRKKFIFILKFFLIKAGYVDAFKEAQRRKTKPKTVYTIEDYRKFDSNFNVGKEIIDESDTDKVGI